MVGWNSKVASAYTGTDPGFVNFMVGAGVGGTRSWKSRSRKAASSGARGQKTKKSTARLEQEGGEKSAGRALDPLPVLVPGNSAMGASPVCQFPQNLKLRC